MSVIAIVLELLKEIDAEVMSCPEANVTLGGAEVLNSNPAGALSTSVTPEPAPKSGLFLSAITIDPSVVQAGLDALAELSAEMLVPPVAEVMVTAPKARPARRNVVAKTKRQQSKNPSVLGRIGCASSEFNAAFNLSLLVTKRT